MRKKSVAIVLVLTALVTLAAFIGYMGKETEAVENGVSLEADVDLEEISIGDKIRFHDLLWESRVPTEEPFDFSDMSMGDRIRFHDQLLDQNP